METSCCGIRSPAQGVTFWPASGETPRSTLRSARRYGDSVRLQDSDFIMRSFYDRQLPQHEPISSFGFYFLFDFAGLNKHTKNTNCFKLLVSKLFATWIRFPQQDKLRSHIVFPTKDATLFPFLYAQCGKWLGNFLSQHFEKHFWTFLKNYLFLLFSQNSDFFPSIISELIETKSQNFEFDVRIIYFFSSSNPIFCNSAIN